MARGELGLPNDLVLAASGAISGAGLTYPSLDTMLTARGMGHIDVWSLVRIGDRLGPTLAEALDEVNRETSANTRKRLANAASRATDTPQSTRRPGINRSRPPCLTQRCGPRPSLAA